MLLSSLKDDDLAGRIGLQAKELNKLMAVLANDRLVKVYVIGFLLSIPTLRTSILKDIVKTNLKKARNAP